MAEGDDTSGQGFDTKAAAARAEAEARGRQTLDRLRAENAQGNAPSPVSPTPIVEEDEDDGAVAAPSPILGLAGFLIFVGIAALFVGGPLWESTGMSPEDSMVQADSSPAFGFVPKSPDSPPR